MFAVEFIRVLYIQILARSRRHLGFHFSWLLVVRYMGIILPSRLIFPGLTQLRKGLYPRGHISGMKIPVFRNVLMELGFSFTGL